MAVSATRQSLYHQHPVSRLQGLFQELAVVHDVAVHKHRHMFADGALVIKNIVRQSGRSEQRGLKHRTQAAANDGLRRAFDVASVQSTWRIAACASSETNYWHRMSKTTVVASLTASF